MGKFKAALKKAAKTGGRVLGKLGKQAYKHGKKFAKSDTGKEFIGVGKTFAKELVDIGLSHVIKKAGHNPNLKAFVNKFPTTRDAANATGPGRRYQDKKAKDKAADEQQSRAQGGQARQRHQYAPGVVPGPHNWPGFLANVDPGDNYSTGGAYESLRPPSRGGRSSAYSTGYSDYGGGGRYESGDTSGRFGGRGGGFSEYGSDYGGSSMGGGSTAGSRVSRARGYVPSNGRSSAGSTNSRQSTSSRQTNTSYQNPGGYERPVQRRGYQSSALKQATDYDTQAAGY